MGVREDILEEEALEVAPKGPKGQLVERVRAGGTVVGGRVNPSRQHSMCEARKGRTMGMMGETVNGWAGL